jgi:hypothetical protein
MLPVGWTCEIRVCLRVMHHGRLGTINWADRLAILTLDACHVQTPAPCPLLAARLRAVRAARGALGRGRLLAALLVPQPRVEAERERRLARERRGLLEPGRLPRLLGPLDRGIAGGAAGLLEAVDRGEGAGVKGGAGGGGHLCVEESGRTLISSVRTLIPLCSTCRSLSVVAKVKARSSHNLNRATWVQFLSFPNARRTKRAFFALP